MFSYMLGTFIVYFVEMICDRRWQPLILEQNLQCKAMIHILDTLLNLKIITLTLKCTTAKQIVKHKKMYHGDPGILIPIPTYSHSNL